MPKTLIGARPELENDLRAALQKAAYNAFLTTHMQSEDATVTNHALQTLTTAAQKFSDRFADEASQPIATAIYKFVKEIAIEMVPTGTLVAGPYPATGVVGPNNFYIT